MRKYECPECHELSVPYNKSVGKCLKCGHSFSTKQFERLDLFHKKHIEKPPEPVNLIQPEPDLIKKTIPIQHKSIQHFEPIVSKTLNAIPNLWYMKIQVNPMAHHPTVGDYIVLTPNHNIVLECKEIDISKNKQFPFSRFTQLQRMIKFKHALLRNEAYIGIMIWNGEPRTKEREIYIIPVTIIDAYIKAAHKQGMNIDEIRQAYENYRIPFGNLESYIKKYWVNAE